MHGHGNVLTKTNLTSPAMLMTSHHSEGALGEQDAMGLTLHYQYWTVTSTLLVTVTVTKHMSADLRH